MRHAYNFSVLDGGRKKNTCAVGDLVDDVLFVSVSHCFTLRYLRYHEALFFRGYVTSHSVAWAYKDVFGRSDVACDFNKQHADGLFYFMAMQELESVGKHQAIEVGNEVSDVALSKYDRHLHNNVFPPLDRNAVKEIVVDGHEKVSVKCSGQGPRKWAGRHRTNKPKLVRSRNNGWFMAVDPKSKRILSVREQVEPENNEIVMSSLKSVLPLYPKCNASVYDRACKFAPSAEKEPTLKQLKYYIVDKFHATKHNAKCKCNPQKIPSLQRRLRGVATPICESLFSWFRGYARSFNELRPRRHRFVTLYFAKKHNNLVDTKDIAHLQKHNAKNTKKRTGCYACNKKKKVRA
jgi:hypothetical protein